MASFVGWIIWGALVFFAASWTFGIFHYLKIKRKITKATILQTASFWVIAIVFLLNSWNKLHILWFAPFVYLIEMIVSPSLFGGLPLRYCLLGILEMLLKRKGKRET